MSIIQETYSTSKVIEKLLFAPVEHPEIIPTIVPLMLGAIVLELYFGKYTTENLGWNTSVGNALIWTSTGISLFFTTDLTQSQEAAALFLIATGTIVGILDFFHIWPEKIAFFISSSGLVYTLAYTIVLMVKTQMPLTENTLKGALIFFIGINIFFKIIQSLETSKDQEI